MVNSRAAAALCFAALLSTPSHALAWGSEGHHIAAEIEIGVRVD
jgi:hypothetical protein